MTLSLTLLPFDSPLPLATQRRTCVSDEFTCILAIRKSAYSLPLMWCSCPSRLLQPFDRNDNAKWQPHVEAPPPVVSDGADPRCSAAFTCPFAIR